MNSKNSWSTFFVSIGLLVIVLSPDSPNPMVGVIMGLVIILTAYLVGRRRRKNNSEGKV